MNGQTQLQWAIGIAAIVLIGVGIFTKFEDDINAGFEFDTATEQDWDIEGYRDKCLMILEFFKSNEHLMRTNR